MKIYKWHGKYYCEEDLSEQYEDGEWGGDLYDFWWDLRHEAIGFHEETFYFYEETSYDEYEDLIAEEMSDCVVGEVEDGQ